MINTQRMLNARIGGVYKRFEGKIAADLHQQWRSYYCDGGVKTKLASMRFTNVVDDDDDRSNLLIILAYSQRRVDSNAY